MTPPVSLEYSMKRFFGLQVPLRLLVLWTLLGGRLSVLVVAQTNKDVDAAVPQTNDNRSREWIPPSSWRSPRTNDNKNAKRTKQHQNDCQGNAICVGPGKTYPIGRLPGVMIHSTFRVPPLPQSFDVVEMTYYDYLNIFWRSQPAGGHFNQFVPQLMLGNALANSSNFPDYKPQWLPMDSWHIGAQYFMGILKNATADDTNDQDSDFDDNTKNPNDWVGKAATGKLIPVQEGEIIETVFELVQVQDRFEWHLRMGVQGDDLSRSSIVVADQPYMGLLKNSTTSWMEDIYDLVYVGSCLENYGMIQAANYPQTWQIDVTIQLPPPSSSTTANLGKVEQRRNADMTEEFDWQNWHMDQDRHCDWQPVSYVTSWNASSSEWQKAVWKAVLNGEDEDTQEQMQR